MEEARGCDVHFLRIPMPYILSVLLHLFLSRIHTFVQPSHQQNSNGDQSCSGPSLTMNMMQVSLRGRQRRESFERRIRRPHFHVKPLDDAQLSAWSQYLDFEMAQVPLPKAQSCLLFFLILVQKLVSAV